MIPRRARIRTALGAPVSGLLAYALVATVVQLHALRHYASSTQPDGDVPQTDWFLAWTEHAVTRQLNPWITDVVNYPHGVNLAWNTTLPLPGLLLAPVTAAWGPVAAHNAALWLAVASSMVAMRWCAAAVTRRPLTAWCAGLAYGCSPYLVAQSAAHLNLALVVLPPVLTRVLLELCTGRAGVRRSAVRLAAVVVAQFLITEEVLVSSLVTAVLAGAVLALRHRRAVTRALITRVFRAVGGAALISLVPLALPLWFQLFGRDALTGPANEPVSISADVLGLVVPGRSQLLASTASDGFSGNPSENGSFVGIGLLLLVAWCAWRYRDQTRDWCLVAVVAWVLSLGGFVRFDHAATPIKLPFLAIWKVPLLGSLAPARFSLYVWLALVLAVCAANDHWRAPRSLPQRATSLAVSAAVVIPLLPHWPLAYVRTSVPGWIQQGAYRALPRGSVLETYPLARHRYGSPTSSPVDWQADAGFWYCTTAGHIIVRAPNGSGQQEPEPTAWELDARGAVAHAPGDAALDQRVRAEWQELRVAAIAVDVTAHGEPDVEQLLQRLTGRAADERRLGMAVWHLAPAGV